MMIMNPVITFPAQVKVGNFEIIMNKTNNDKTIYFVGGAGIAYVLFILCHVLYASV